MLTLSNRLIIIVSVVYLNSCSNTTDKKVGVRGAEDDSLKVVTKMKGDTVIKSYFGPDNKTDDSRIDTFIYSSKSIDETIAVSNFVFDFRQFRIYFDTAKVIAYCDSVMKNTPADKEDGDRVNSSIVNSATHLKYYAKFPNQTETLIAGWCETLFERFEPLIIDTTTNQKAIRLLREKFTNGVTGHRRYYALTNQGDTAMVGYEQDYYNLELLELEAPKDKNGR